MLCNGVPAACSPTCEAWADFWTEVLLPWWEGDLFQDCLEQGHNCDVNQAPGAEL